ncbi:uncharacterized protein LOC134181879 isoform X2 [Corticium candelabrum]|uniref:uncharacterized protein LOC134181879 isoform X2 n=1 Tax=Corticium candelabrum TaxID=121492 RepID=UPI002E2624E7|nr:uncharacterized protein LOC134181879 isoform X2 [Corticium candelabrum]
MSSAVTSEGVTRKNALEQALSHSVKELQRHYATQPTGFVLTSSSAFANELCSVLEALFLHELKMSLSAKVSSSLAKLDVRRKNTTSVASQSWIRLALNDGLIENYFEAVLVDRSLISSMYKQTAFILDQELTFATRSLLQGLTILTFKLTYDSDDLNTWPSVSLQLAGLQELPTEQTSDHSVMASYDPMASFSTLGSALKAREIGKQEASDSEQSQTHKVKSTGGHKKRSKPRNLIPARIAEERDRTESRHSNTIIGSYTKDHNFKHSDGDRGETAVNTDDGEGTDFTVMSDDRKEDKTEPILIQTVGKSRPHTKGRSATDVSDISLSLRRQEDGFNVPPHLDTSEASVVGTPADSFGFLLKKHQRRRSHPARWTIDRDTRPSNLEDLANLSYDMVTPSGTTATQQGEEYDENAELMGYEVIQSSPSQSPPATPSMESRQNLLTHISREQGLDSQNFQCRDCSAPIGMIFGHAKVCTFNARYYCKDCHKDEEVLIPARIIHNWDFNKHKVCHSNKEYLDSIEEEPLFNLAKINPSLYDHVPELKDVRKWRHQLGALVPYVYTCQTRVWEDFRKKVWGKEYLFENEDLYSIADFLHVQSHQLASYLKKSVSSALKHVHRCKVCCQKGFICEICNNPKIIYPFEVHSTSQCQKCQSVFHKSCKTTYDCPKCARLNERQQRRQQEQEAIDEPSPPPTFAGDQ